MLYWQWSLVWTIIDDPVKRLFELIYRELRAVYQKIADNAYADVDKNCPPPPLGDDRQ